MFFNAYTNGMGSFLDLVAVFQALGKGLGVFLTNTDGFLFFFFKYGFRFFRIQQDARFMWP